jgi:hypothetical protein
MSERPTLETRPTRKRFGLEPAQALSLVGIVAAVAIAVLLNVLSARHYKRWDWTTGGRYTLHPATVETLHSIPDSVELWVLLGGGDPLEQSIKQLVVAYQAETTKLDVHWIDPDRDAPAFHDVRKRFRIDAERGVDGRVVTDAIMVVAHGDRHWFLQASDMIEVGEDGTQARPREEQAITGALRNVLGGEKAVLCFTSGHGERSITDGSDEGLGLLKDVLEKDNYDVRTVDTTAQDATEPYKGCTVALVVPGSVRTGSMGALSEPEAERLRTWVLEGGNVFVALGPESDAPVPALARVLEPFGIALDAKWVLEADPKLAFPDTRLNTFVATPKPHAVTTGLVPNPDTTRTPPRVVLEMVRPLMRAGAPGAATSEALLVTSDQSFAVGFARASAIARGAEPAKAAEDMAGPFIVAMASERPKVGASAAHGPRAVVLGSAAPFAAMHWRQATPWRGSAVLVENAVSWLAAKPQILDVPARPSVAAGIRVSDESRSEVRRYVLAYMPLAIAVLGVGMALVRRSTEGKLARRKKRKDEEESDEEEENEESGDGDGDGKK